MSNTAVQKPRHMRIKHRNISKAKHRERGM